MSTQLVLYPQNYQGYSYGQPVNQWLIDGINFTSIDAASSVTMTGNWIDILTAQPPAIVNTWYRHREDAGIDYPTESNGNLIFDAVSGTPSDSTVYQRLSNLAVGQVYNVTIDLVSDTSGAWLVLIADGNTYSSLGGTVAGYNITQITTQFTAATTEDILVLSWTDSNTNTITVTNISVTQASIVPTGIYTQLQDGQVICDLYQEEDIPLTLSIDDFKNVAEKVQSYSKDFNLPATKRNNQIFNNMFEITRADDGLIFNPYVRTKCALKQDGFILFEGYLRLIDVKENEGEISYNVNLYSEVITLADVLKDRKFSDLDFTELDHDYERLEIVNSWNDSGTGITYLNAGTSGFRDANDTVKYPFIDWNHQISLTNSEPVLANLETAFRPCIQLKYLIDRIFAATDFTYTSDFFNTEDFKKLYMDFNWGSDANANDWSQWGSAKNTGSQTGIGGTYVNIVTDTNNFPDEFGYSNTTGFTSQFDNATLFAWAWFKVDATGSGATFHHRWLHTEAATGNTTEYNLGSWTATSGTPPGDNTEIESSVTVSMAINDTLQFQAKTSGPYGVYITQWAPLPQINQYRGNLSVDIATSSTLLQTLRGELGQWDFLKGLLTMFNLVTLADEDNPDNILIVPYADVFIKNTNSGNTSDLTLAKRSIQHDWTDKVDVSQMELKPLTDLNKETIFKFVEDDDDYAFKVFKNAQSGYLYGSLEYDASEFTVLEGAKEIVAEPFAATVVKPLMSQFSDFIVPVIYAKGGDDTWEGFDNSPRIFYNNGVKTLTSCEYTVPSQNGVSSTDLSTFLQFSHLSDIPSVSSSSIDFNFSSHQLASQGVGNPPIDNLFYTYWQPYFNELYNPDTRIMTLKVNLNPSDIATFKMYDTVMIKNRTFRVNKIEYKPNSLAKVEFILIP
jgi:hypothetical protein